MSGTTLIVIGGLVAIAAAALVLLFLWMGSREK